jgi:DNA-nicking Smr family endonuclease
MSTKKKPPGHSLLRNACTNSSSSAFYTPFEDLSRRLMAVAPAQPARPVAGPSVVAEPAAPVAAEDEALLFRQAMVDVIPLDRATRARVPQCRTPGTSPRFARREEMEVYAHLVDLVSGNGSFELSYSDEYVDGAVVGLSPKVLNKLRKGAFSYQDYVDLHGFSRVQAHQVVIDFVRRSFAQGYRCILIVSGRGLNSEQRQPVLKDHLVIWLTHSPLKRLVLAFASARSHDGGVGAFYVLLRRGERKAPFVTPAGLDRKSSGG